MSGFPQATSGSSAGPISSNGIYIPNGWGRITAAKLKATATTPITLAVVGDSIAQGFYSSNLLTKSWPALLKSKLQGLYGNGGSGFFSVANSSAVLTSLGLGGSPLAAYVAIGNNLWTVTGTWTTGGGYGPGYYASYNGTLNNTISSPAIIIGQYVDMFSYAVGKPATYSIDSGAFTGALPTGSGGAPAKTTVNTGSSATTAHSVTFTTGTGGTNNMVILGVTGRNSSGVRLDEFAAWGATTSIYNNQEATPNAYSGSWSGGANNPADLVLYNVGNNDATADVAVATSLSNIDAYLQGVLDSAYYGGTVNSTGVEVAFVLSFIGKNDATAPQYSALRSGIAGLATAYNAAVLDLGALASNNWTAMQAAGYMGNSASLGAAGTDPIHLSDAGHAWVATQIESLLSNIAPAI